MTESNLGAAQGDWLGAIEAARFLGVHRSTLHVAIRQRLIVPDGRTPGGHARFRRETLDAYRAHLAGGPATGNTGVFVRLHTLTDLTRLLALSTPPQQFAQAAAACIQRALPGVEMACVAVRANAESHGNRHMLRILAQEGFPEQMIIHFERMQSRFGFAMIDALRGRVMEICPDTSQRRLRSGTAYMSKLVGATAYAVLPILGDQEEALGIILCASASPRDFDAQDIAFLSSVTNLLAVSLTAPTPTVLHQDRRAVMHTLNIKALRLRAEAARSSREGAKLDAIASGARSLTELFLRQSGAIEVCALGFGPHDTPTADFRLSMLACAACAPENHGWAHETWKQGQGQSAAIETGAAICAPRATGELAAVGALWHGRREDLDTDRAMLAALASAYLLTTME